MFPRILSAHLRMLMDKPYGLLLFGPRQVGKTTLLMELLKDRKNILKIYLQDYGVFQSYLKDSGLFKRQVLERLENSSPKNPLFVFIDEVQKIPALLNDCQWLYDQYKGLFHFIVTGSSARKLRRADANLLPGRGVVQYLHPLIWNELGNTSFQKLFPQKILTDFKQKKMNTDGYLLYGTLPGILSVPQEDRALLLQSYAQIYLKEEIQAEALVRSLEGFSQFLELAAIESGNTTNYQKLGKDIGLKLNTVKNYYTILIDTLVAISLDPYLKNARKRLISTPKIYFFDTGVRNACAGLPFEKAILKSEGGRLFEHFIILEIYRRLQYEYPTARCYFWRTAAGAEVDLVIDTKKELIPIEIKYTTTTRNINTRNLTKFMEEYECKKGYIVGCFNEPEKIDDRIIALPWRMI